MIRTALCSVAAKAKQAFKNIPAGILKNTGKVTNPKGTTYKVKVTSVERFNRMADESFKNKMQRRSSNPASFSGQVERDFGNTEKKK